jgi:phage gpG-like protein
MGINIEADIRFAVESFRFNETELRALLQGPVVKDLTRRAIRVQSSAKQHASGRPGPNVITGRLRGSITWRVGQDAASPYVDVGSNVEYAPYVELGTSRMPPYPYLRPGLEAARTT